MLAAKLARGGVVRLWRDEGLDRLAWFTRKNSELNTKSHRKTVASLGAGVADRRKAATWASRHPKSQRCEGGSWLKNRRRRHAATHDPRSRVTTGLQFPPATFKKRPKPLIRRRTMFETDRSGRHLVKPKLLVKIEYRSNTAEVKGATSVL